MKKSKLKKEIKALIITNFKLQLKVVLLELKIKMNRSPKFPSGGFVANDKTEKPESAFNHLGPNMQELFKNVKSPFIHLGNFEKFKNPTPEEIKKTKEEFESMVD